MKLNVRALTVQVYRRESTGDGFGTKSVHDGSLTGDVEVEISERVIKQIAERALRARSRRAVVGNGLAVFKARNVKKVPANG